VAEIGRHGGLSMDARAHDVNGVLPRVSPARQDPRPSGVYSKRILSTPGE
jgi:hypothetical protein